MDLGLAWRCGRAPASEMSVVGRTDRDRRNAGIAVYPDRHLGLTPERY
jgi:hypothetical protein